MALNKILADERLQPNRKLLAELIVLYLDSDGPEEKELFSDLLRSVYTKRGVDWNDSEDVAEPVDSLTKKASDSIRNILGNLPLNQKSGGTNDRSD